MKINRHLPALICLSVLLLILSVSGYAQTGTVQVSCVDESGSPVKGVKVELRSLDNTTIDDEKSNGDGIAEIKNIANGVYRVVGSKKNYAPAYHEYLKLQGGQESASLTLKSGDQESLLYFEDAARLQRSADLMMQGVNASKEGRFDDAEQNLKQSIELNPSNSQSLYFLGVYYVQVRKYDQAVETLGAAGELAGMFADLPPVPGQADPAQNRAIQNDAKRLIKSMAGIKGELALQAKKYDEAVSSFTENVENNPNDPEAYYQLSLALTYMERYDDAMARIDKAIELKPAEQRYPALKEQISARMINAAIEKAQTVLNEGNELLTAEDASGALVKFQEALTLLDQERQSIVWRQIGNARAKLNQSEEAEEAYRKAVEFASDDNAADYLNILARFYLESKNFESALDALTDPRSLGSGSEEKVLLDLFEKSKDSEPKLAEAALERVIKANPENTEAYFTLGRMYYADGKEMDHRTKELLTRYIEIGKDPLKVSQSKDLLVIINRRSE